jgi:putative phosphoribosyl transferase
VEHFLRQARQEATGVSEWDVEIQSGGVTLPSILSVPDRACGVVLFAHGSGSGRLSPRNTAVARSLQESGFATLLADLLTEREAQDRRLVFDIPLLAQRLLDCLRWVQHQRELADLPAGFFGASTGGGAALVAAAQAGEDVRAVVSRGGRPDLAGPYLEQVRCPTLLIVGGHDEPVIELNKQALSHLRGTQELIIVPGATHLFEEPGTLEEVARLAGDWFLTYLQMDRVEE